MKRTGELLRKARESRGISLNEIALTLKINSKTLTAIEEGDLSKLPAKTFLRGFVQSYAQVLKIDPDEILNTFAEEMGTPRVSPAPPSIVFPGEAATEDLPPVDIENSPAPISASAPSPTQIATAPPETSLAKPLPGLETENRTRTIIFGSVLLALLLLIFGTKKVIERYQRESQATPVEVAHPLPAPPAPPTAPVTAVATDHSATPPLSGSIGETPQDKASTVTNSAAPLDVTSHAPTPSPATASIPESPPTKEKPNVAPAPPPAAHSDSPPVAPPTTPSSVAEKKTEDSAEPKAAAKAEEKEKEKKKQPKSIELIIEALDNVDIEITSAEGVPTKMTLAADHVHTVRGKAGMKLQVSNGGAVNLTLNGRDLGVPGDLGKPVKLSY